MEDALADGREVCACTFDQETWRLFVVLMPLAAAPFDIGQSLRDLLILLDALNAMALIYINTHILSARKKIKSIRHGFHKKRLAFEVSADMATVSNWFLSGIRMNIGKALSLLFLSPERRAAARSKCLFHAGRESRGIVKRKPVRTRVLYP